MQDRFHLNGLFGFALVSNSPFLVHGIQSISICQFIFFFSLIFYSPPPPPPFLKKKNPFSFFFFFFQRGGKKKKRGGGGYFIVVVDSEQQYAIYLRKKKKLINLQLRTLRNWTKKMQPALSMLSNMDVIAICSSNYRSQSYSHNLEKFRRIWWPNPMRALTGLSGLRPLLWAVWSWAVALVYILCRKKNGNGLGSCGQNACAPGCWPHMEWRKELSWSKIAWWCEIGEFQTMLLSLNGWSLTLPVGLLGLYGYPK